MDRRKGAVAASQAKAYGITAQFVRPPAGRATLFWCGKAVFRIPGELPVRQLWIDGDALRKLEKDVWSERYVPAAMIAGNRRYAAKVRYRGGHTREYPKRSYEVIRAGKTYHYNAEYDDPSMIRNALSFHFFRAIGVPAPRARHCLLTLNGKSLGVYLEIEGVKRPFFRRRGIPVRALFYAVNNLANFGLRDSDTHKKKASLDAGYTQMIGNVRDRKRLTMFIRRLNRRGDPAAEAYLRKKVDIDNYLRWLAGAVLTGNFDGFEQNYALYLHAVKRKYRMIPWDYEGTWGRNCYGKACGSDLVSVRGYNRLTDKLLSYRRVRRSYKRLLRRLLRKQFTLQELGPVIDRLYLQIRPHIQLDSSRKWSVREFDAEPQFIRRYIEERRELVLRELHRL